MYGKPHHSEGSSRYLFEGSKLYMTYNQKIDKTLKISQEKLGANDIDAYNNEVLLFLII